MDITYEEHYQKLEWMYVHAAPINKIYQPTINIAKGSCEIKMACNRELFHSAGALHGSVYFKMLDDAAFFAASSLETGVFLLTSTFNIHFLRPVLYGELLAKASVISYTKQQIVAEAILINLETNKEVARGTGNFLKSPMPLDESVGYK
ncbi:PaaI family thioesterase [Fulvivirga sp. M361]|uniref:PaaI family thioesterase n=1 Tax=Fulvivirga sp. M361 TaxID=2594266 RepID=UPI00117A4BEC|nr:PaaI family thioesterase [Fulvivirga sp. M361]TRX62177.1 PaaI family thioesterase [Fulvivirga sp. M361]